MEDKLLARRRMLKRLSTFVGRDGEGATEQADKVRNKTRTSSIRASLSRVFSRPVVIRRRRPSIEFIPRDSETLKPRIEKPSRFKAVWRFLKDGFVEPIVSELEDSYIYQLRSFSLYIMHVILLFWAVYGTFDAEYNYQNIIMSDLIGQSYFESKFVVTSLKFHEIRVPEQIWEFIRGVMLKILYPLEASNDTHSILQDNIMIGVAQLRQVRVKKDSCQTAPFFKDLFKHCYGYFFDQELDEDREPFGLKTPTPWVWTRNNEGKLSRGKFFTFNGDGYALNFTQDYSWTVDQLKELEDNRWIRLGTRAVFLDFATFCPNVNAFLVVKICFEIMPWGAVFPRLKFYSLKLLMSLNDANAFVILGVNVVLLGYTVGLNYMVFLRLKRTGMSQLLTFKNLVDIAIISSTYVALGVHIALAYYTNKKLDPIVKMVHKSENPSFGVLIYVYELYKKIAAILCFCIAVKALRYGAYFNETIKIFFCTLRKVKGELICFTIMNLSILFGWSFVFCSIYGRISQQMNTPWDCLTILIYQHARAYEIVGKKQLKVTGDPHMRILMAMTVPFALFYINCISQTTYVALIVHGWRLAVKDCAKVALRIKAFETPLIRFVTILENLKLFKAAQKLQEYYIMQMNEDDYFPMIHMMRGYGWSHLEIRMLLKKHGIQKGDDLSLDELFEVYQDFWTRNALFFEVKSHDKIKNDFQNIGIRIKYVESTIADLKISVERLADQVLKTKARPFLRESTSPHRGSVRWW